MRRGYEAKVKRRENEVCERLREARTRLGFSQAFVASSLNITRARWASYEEKRAALNWYQGLKFCSEFKVNPEWLAKGKGGFEGISIPLPESVVGKVPDTMPFGEAYDRYYGLSADAVLRIELQEMIAKARFDGDDEVQSPTDALGSFDGFLAGASTWILLASLDDFIRWRDQGPPFAQPIYQYAISCIIDALKKRIGKK